jgi:hypothetical protein
VVAAEAVEVVVAQVLAVAEVEVEQPLPLNFLQLSEGQSWGQIHKRRGQRGAGC